MSLLAHRPLSCEPPPGRSKLRGAGLCAARSQGVRGTVPSAYLATAGRAVFFWRRLIRWLVGELFPGSGSEGGVRGPETYPRPSCSTCGVRVSLPIPIRSIQCYALPKLAVCAVSLSMCITCSASPKLMVLILCSLSGCAPGCAPFSSFSLLHSPHVTLPLNVSLDLGFDRWSATRLSNDRHGASWVTCYNRSQGLRTLGHGLSMIHK